MRTIRATLPNGKEIHATWQDTSGPDTFDVAGLPDFDPREFKFASPDGLLRFLRELEAETGKDFQIEDTGEATPAMR